MLVMIIGVALCIFSAIGYLLALEGIAFFEGLKSFFMVIFAFGGILLCFVALTVAILWMIDKITFFLKSSKRRMAGR
jgi:hypothetical protein